MKDKFSKLYNKFWLNDKDNHLWNATVDDNILRLHEGLMDLCVACEQLADMVEQLEKQINNGKH